MAKVMPSEMFTVNKVDKIMSAFISDVQGNGGLDDGDWLVRIKSKRTGKVECFRYSSDERDREGEITTYIFVPATFTLRDAGWVLYLFND